MPYATVPKDLSHVKTKVFFGLTKRQLICFGLGALIGVPIFFITRQALGSSAATLIMVAVMLPCFAFGLYEKNGQPLEKLLRQIIQTKFIRPRQRPYQTNNLYAALQRQSDAEKEVRQIVQGKPIQRKKERREV